MQKNRRTYLRVVFPEIEEGSKEAFNQSFFGHRLDNNVFPAERQSACSAHRHLPEAQFLWRECNASNYSMTLGIPALRGDRCSERSAGNGEMSKHVDKKGMAGYVPEWSGGAESAIR